MLNKTMLKVLNNESFHKELGACNNVDIVYTEDMLFNMGDGDYVAMHTTENTMSCELVKAINNTIEIYNYGYSADFDVYLGEDYEMEYCDFENIGIEAKAKMLVEYGEAMLEGAYEQYKKVITVEEDGTVVDVKLYIQEGNNVFKGVESYSL